MRILYELPISQIGAFGYEERVGKPRRVTRVTSLDPVLVVYDDTGDECPVQTEALITRSQIDAEDLETLVASCPPERRAEIEAQGLSVADETLLGLTRLRLDPLGILSSL